MSTMVAYFTSSLHYFGGNYFRIISNVWFCLIIENLGRSIIQGADLYTDVADRVDLAIKQYDQALLLQMADLMFGKSANVLVPTCRSSNRDEIAGEAT